MSRETRRVVIASWAALGVVAVMAESVVRLTRVALGALREGLTPGQWAALAAGVLFMGYVEGYRAFSRSFGPRVVERAFALGRAPTPAHVALAPLYAMSLVGDARGRLVRSWALVLGIVALVVLVRQLPPVWRGIVDASVAVSLTWGIAVIGSLWISTLRRELAPRVHGGGAPSTAPPPC